MLLEANIGLMLTPISQRNAPNDSWVWAADNACFSNKWKETTWLSWLKSKDKPADALFATVPDVVADHESTLKLWNKHWQSVAELQFKPAYVIQNGAVTKDVPFHQAKAIFIGGTTDWKLSIAAQKIVVEAKKLNLWVHMGRVNSVRRLQIAQEWGCDSVDGTYVAFAPDANAKRLVAYMNKTKQQQSLFAGMTT